MRQFGRALLLATALVGSVGVVAGPPVSAAPASTAAARASAVASTTPSAVQAAGAAAYWTRERMAEARPYVVTPRAGTRTAAPSSAQPAGPQVSVPPVSGSLDGGATTQAASALGRPYTDLPDRLNVKIFFSKATGGNFVCSGTIVNSATKRMVSTAGHCVSDGASNFHRNVVVVPAYSSNCNGCGDAPFGRWTARTLTTLNEWHVFGNLKQDLGYVVVNDLGGQRIVNRLGGHGTTFNAARAQFFRAYGYPQASPFNGFNQYVCPSNRLADDNPNSRPGPLTIRISCNMTGGSSGGGWLINLASNGLGWVNSVNSYKYVSGPLANANHMYGPYFGNEARSLYDFAVAQG